MTGRGGGVRGGACAGFSHARGRGRGEGGMHETEVFKTSGRGYVNLGEVNTWYYWIPDKFLDTKYGGI
jgi:hypothetical protein